MQTQCNYTDLNRAPQEASRSREEISDFRSRSTTHRGWENVQSIARERITLAARHKQGTPGEAATRTWDKLKNYDPKRQESKNSRRGRGRGQRGQGKGTEKARSRGGRKDGTIRSGRKTPGTQIAYSLASCDPENLLRSRVSSNRFYKRLLENASNVLWRLRAVAQGMYGAVKYIMQNRDANPK